MTKEQVRAGLEIVLAVSDAIRELGEVPSGHLYAHLMGKLSIDDYNKIISILVGAKLITNQGHLLRWVGPTKGE